MPWFRVDDSFWSHPKTLDLNGDAVALWVRAGAYAMQHLTDGALSRRMLRVLGATPDDAAELVAAGLWEQDGDGWRFHDWDDYQPSADAVQTIRKGRQTGAARANHERWHVARGVREPGCAYCIPDSRSTDRSSDHSTETVSESLTNPPVQSSPNPTHLIDSPTARQSISPARDDRQTDAEALANAIHEHTGLRVTPERAAQIGADIVAKASSTVRSPQSYVLAAVRNNPQEVRQVVEADMDRQWEQAMAEKPHSKTLAQLDGYELSLVQDHVRGFRPVLPSHLRAAAEEARRERETA